MLFDWLLSFCCFRNRRNRRIKNILFYNKMSNFNIFNFTKINYNYEAADNFRDFENIVPFTTKNYWLCATIKLLDNNNFNIHKDKFINNDKEELKSLFNNLNTNTFLLHLKTNLVFDISSNLIGQIKYGYIDDSIIEHPYLISIDEMNPKLVDWFMNCKKLTDELIDSPADLS